MTQKATERIAWAVEMLDVQPDEQLLEIGCGHGVAVSLVCEQLTRGTITAIDRSQKMIAAATKRNQGCVEAGRAFFACATLEDADLGKARFDKIFAIRVNFFIQQPAVQLPKLKKLLKPAGTLYLINDTPNTSQSAPFVERATASLHAHGFTVGRVVAHPLASAQEVCIVATPS